jgi:AcrR family transcriptional regulator
MSPGIHSVERLPPGRHGLSAEFVVENQRSRILAATCASHRALGYAGMSVCDITDRAGVSRATFYKLFEGKPKCMVAAQNEVAEMLGDEIARAWAPPLEWAERVDRAVEATLLFAARSPEQALLLLSEPDIGDAELARVPLAFHAFLVDLLSDGRELAPDPGRIPRLTEGALIGALRSLIAGRLIGGREAELPTLRAELVHLVLMPYLGPDDAVR